MGQNSEVSRLKGRARVRRRPLRLMLALGTRPEAIKIAPVVLAARNKRHILLRLVSSGQHPRAMLEVLDHFAVPVDQDLALFRNGQSLAHILRTALGGFSSEIAAWRPDVVLVQGDTVSALAAGLAAFYSATPVAHVEAGLRSHNLAQPYPEEMNRLLVDTFAAFLFAPTLTAAANLATEGIAKARVFVTGNTVVDSLFAALRDPRPVTDVGPVGAFIEPNGHRGRVLVTCHRRESWGKGLDAIATGLARAARRFPDHIFLAPLHPNPIVRRSFNGELPKNVLVGDPLPYSVFVKALSVSDLVVTDSGGILEEATCLAKRVLVVRRRTERPEAVRSGQASVIGVDSNAVESAVSSYLAAPQAATEIPAVCAFGDGRAGERIVDWLLWRFGLAETKPGPFDQ